MNRRTLLVGAGAVSVTGLGFETLSQILSQSVSAQPLDLVTSHLTGELKKLNTRVRKARHVSTDHIRQLAGHVRLFSTHPSVAAVQGVQVGAPPFEAQIVKQKIRRHFGSTFLEPGMPDIMPPQNIDPVALTTSFVSDPAGLLQSVAQSMDDSADYFDANHIAPALTFNGQTFHIQQVQMQEYVCWYFKSFFYALGAIAVLLSITGAGEILAGILAGMAWFFDYMGWLSGC